MEKILRRLSVDQLKEMAIKMNGDNRDLAGIVLEKVLIELEIRMTSAEYVKFCRDLENVH